jgi:hypothetical protein
MNPPNPTPPAPEEDLSSLPMQDPPHGKGKEYPPEMSPEDEDLLNAIWDQLAGQ